MVWAVPAVVAIVASVLLTGADVGVGVTDTSGSAVVSVVVSTVPVTSGSSEMSEGILVPPEVF